MGHPKNRNLAWVTRRPAGERHEGVRDRLPVERLHLKSRGRVLNLRVRPRVALLHHAPQCVIRHRHGVNRFIPRTERLRPRFGQVAERIVGERLRPHRTAIPAGDARQIVMTRSEPHTFLILLSDFGHQDNHNGHEKEIQAKKDCHIKHPGLLD